ncbi:hypothetical protein [Empedobacter falsenii]
MKITIPTPCKEKLQDDNFCAKCQHKITDFSNFTNDEISNEFQKNSVHCGIFHPSQLGQNLFMKTISNVMIFSAFGLMSTSSKAQKPNTACHDNPLPINNSIENESIEFKIIVTKSYNTRIQEFSTFRLLINGELIEQTLKVGEEYTIKCDVQKGLPIDIRLASNENILDITKSYTTKNLPKKLKFSTSDFELKGKITGEIVPAPTIQGIIAIKK